MVYPQILCKTFLKLKVTTIILVMPQHFLQEILKQLDIVYRPSFTGLQKFGTFYPKSWNELLIWMNWRTNWKSDSLKTVPATDWVYYIMSFNKTFDWEREVGGGGGGGGGGGRAGGRGVVSATILMVLWYKSTLNWNWEKAERFDEILFVVDIIIR